MWFNDFIRALAELIRALAWPTVAIVIVVRHRVRLDELLSRVRELLGGTKFDPAVRTNQIAELSTNPVETAQNVAGIAPTDDAIGSALPPEFAALRTPVVTETEGEILSNSPLARITDPAIREQALLTLSAALNLLFRFERIESVIWGSQIDLLEYLNRLALDGESHDVLRVRFYEPAVASGGFSGLRYKDYPFDQYLSFLRSLNLITEAPGGSVRFLITEAHGGSVRFAITEFGREYLVWRVRDGRGKKSQ